MRLRMRCGYERRIVSRRRNYDAFTHSSLKGTTMKLLITLLAAALFGTLAGCNTIEGAGKDLERGGEKVQDTARDVKRSM